MSFWFGLLGNWRPPWLFDGAAPGFGSQNVLPCDELTPLASPAGFPTWWSPKMVWFAFGRL